MSTTVRPQPYPRALYELLDRVALESQGDLSTTATGITHDSREVVPGDIYAALPGFTVHGARFAQQAVAAGAVAVLTDAEGVALAGVPGTPLLIAADPRAIVGHVAAWVYGDPAEDLLMIGITGTNGKTTTSYLVDAGLRATGRATGLIGTIGTRIGDSTAPTVRTTPEATDVHALLAVMRERGVTCVTMEVSSHALALHRVGGLVFDVVGFTNLSQDHLDFHGDMENYFTAKASLFTSEHARRGIVCIDDEWGRRLADTSGISVTSLATDGALADWQVSEVSRTTAGRAVIDVRQPDGSLAILETALPGRFNVANVVLAHALLRTAGVATGASVTGLAMASGVPGRMERIDGGDTGVDIFVDYAHSPDAVERVVETAREFTSGRVIVVLGGGGDRDRDKRPHMGRAASAADVVVVTDDNPRSETPANIRASIRAGIPEGVEWVELADRRLAIEHAVTIANAGDTVLILGKGHETGQEVAGVMAPFDDRVEAAAAVDTRTSSGAL